MQNGVIVCEPRIPSVNQIIETVAAYGLTPEEERTIRQNSVLWIAPSIEGDQKVDMSGKISRD